MADPALHFDPANPLAELADIIEPELNLPFQLAPGWWLLIILLLLLSGVLIVWLFRRWQFLAARREALLLLKQTDLTRNSAAADINLLLKRLLLHYSPAHPALTASGQQWQQFLQQQLPDISLPDLTPLLYSQTPDTEALQQFFQFARQWLLRFNGTFVQHSSRGQQISEELKADV